MDRINLVEDNLLMESIRRIKKMVGSTLIFYF